MFFSGENLLFLFKMYFHQKSNVLLLFNENKANRIIVIKCWESSVDFIAVVVQ